MAKYRVTVTDHHDVFSQYGKAKKVHVYRVRRVLPAKVIGQDLVFEKRDVEAEEKRRKGRRARYGDYAAAWASTPYDNIYLPITVEQIKTAALRIVADYEFPAPDLEVCKPAECKKL